MKINKKILLTLLFLFVLSNTGLPVVLHFCGMGKKVKFESCNMCKAQSRHDYAQSSGKDIDTHSQKISKIKHNCCDIKVLASPISEKYISVKVDKSEIKSFGFTAIIINNDLQNTFVSKWSNLLINSPPDNARNDLYLNNSILLI